MLKSLDFSNLIKKKSFVNDDFFPVDKMIKKDPDAKDQIHYL